MKKSFLRAFAALLSVTFCIGCSGSPVSKLPNVPASLTSSGPVNVSILESSILNSSSSTISESILENGFYIFVQGLLVGSYKDDEWHSVSDQDVYIADILEQQAFYCYNQTKFLGVTKKLTLSYKNGIEGSFVCDGDLLIPYAYENDVENEEISLFIPFSLPQNLRYIKYQIYNPNIDYNIYNTHSYFTDLAISANFDPRPKSEVKEIIGKYTSEDEAAVKAELEQLNLPGAPIHIFDVFEFDIDGDNTLEHFIFADTPNIDDSPDYTDEEIENGNSGFYYMVLCKDEISYQPVVSCSCPYKINQYGNINAMDFRSISLIGIFDINNDGIFELCLHEPGEDCGRVLVCSLNKNSEWKCVLTGYHGNKIKQY